MKGSYMLIAGIGLFAVLIVLALMAPLFNTMVTIILGNTDDQMNQLLAIAIFPAMIIMLMLGFYKLFTPSDRGVYYE